MVQELVGLLPKEPGTVGLVIAIIGSVIGAGIWLLGARFSRPIITLLTVALGAVLGVHLPQWFGWQISGAGPAIAAALVLGVTGYVLHSLWVGVGLGTVLSCWAALGCWIGFRNGAGWSWPAITEQTTLTSYLQTLWQQLPPDVARILPYACATAMVTGLAVAIIWSRLALILGWSLAGASLLAGMGVTAVEIGRPQWLAHVPSPMWAQGSLVAALVAVGALVQWKLSRRPAAKKPAKGEPSENSD